MSQGTDWIQEQQDAFNDLAEDGVFFTFTRVGKGAFDPVKSSYAEGESEQFTAPGIMSMQSISTNKAAQKWLADGLVQAGDEILLIGVGEYDPQLEDLVDIDGAKWAVKGVTSLRPAVIPVLHYLLIRKV